MLSKILIGIIASAMFLVFLLAVFLEPWIERRILSTLNDNNKGYLIKAEVIDFSIIKSGLEIKNITIASKPVPEAGRYLNGNISSIRINGINLMQILFKNGIFIREVIISNCRFDGRIHFPKNTTPPIISGKNISIGSILFDTFDLNLNYDSTARSISVKKGTFKLLDLQIKQQDTLSPSILREIEFSDVQEVSAVSTDSMYSFKVAGIRYSASTRTFEADSFSIHPNFPDYEFTSRFKFQKDRIEALLSNINIKSFSPVGYFKSGDLVCSQIKIGNLEMNIFRDKRKKFQHTNKPAFQDLMVGYSGKLQIDSVSISGGSISYAEHTPGASDQGMIYFSHLRAFLYNITNDTLYKKKEGTTMLRAEALLMGKSRLSVTLKARLFDNNNVFTLNGSLANLKADALNPMLEYSAFMYATDGEIDELSFHFTANNTRATGKMTLLYHGLNIAVKNKRTDDTTALKERIISMLANNKILDSNPLPGMRVREGIIDYQRDPERFVFNYAFKSILSGMKSTLLKNPVNVKSR